MPTDAGASDSDAEMGAALLQVEELRVGFAAAGGFVRAVDGVSFEIRKGEVLGLVGE